MDLLHRPRRLRYNEKLRSIVRDVRLSADEFMLPLFIKEGKGIKNHITSMPGHFQFSIDSLDQELDIIAKLGIKSVMLFGIPGHKDAHGSASLKDDGIIQKAIMYIKKQIPDLLVAADVCLCEYTDHGHCGYIEGKEVENDATLEILSKQALSYARAGADIVAPSSMMDGMVQAIRSTLDDSGFYRVPIMSYSVKYASAMYGPFRAAAEGAPKFGDRRSYQMDFANSNESIKETSLDITEGADIIMVKPAHTYLDILYKISTNFPEIPLAAYHTSGEYSMIKAASQNGWIDENSAILEVSTAIKRAGANIIISYFAKDIAKILMSNG